MLKLKKVTVIWIVIAVLASGVLWGAAFIRRQYVLPILMYHYLDVRDHPGDRLVVTVDIFKRQMRFLKERGYNVVSLEELIPLIREKKIPPKTVAITFDDGSRDNFVYAFPILQKYHLPATMFIIIDEVGRPRGDKMSWQEMRIMRDSGLITFGSHALGAEPLINIKSEEELKRQIFDSKKILEEQLSRPVKLFSYPEGRFSPAIRQLVIDAGYALAVTTNPGKRFPNDDIFALKRLRISPTAGNLFVFRIEASGFYNFIRERKQHKRR